MYKAVILDMDGTIIDSLTAIEGTLRKTAGEWGIEITQEMADTAKYSTNEQLHRMLGGNEKAKAFIEAWEKEYHEAAKQTKIFPGMEKVLRSGLRLAIVTSETEEELAWNLKRLGLPESLFECVAGADTTEHVKPHPRPLLHCLEKMKIEPGEALFVGDSQNDMKCAAAAGVDFALARFGEGETTDIDALSAIGFIGMKYILSQPDKILDIILITNKNNNSTIAQDAFF